MGKAEDEVASERKDLDRRRQDRSFYLQFGGFVIMLLSVLAGFVRQATVMERNALEQARHMDEQGKQIVELRGRVDSFLAANQQNAIADAERKAEQKAALERLKEEQADIKLWKSAVDEWMKTMNGNLKVIQEQQRK